MPRTNFHIPNIPHPINDGMCVCVCVLSQTPGCYAIALMWLSRIWSHRHRKFQLSPRWNYPAGLISGSLWNRHETKEIDSSTHTHLCQGKLKPFLSNVSKLWRQSLTLKSHSLVHVSASPIQYQSHVTLFFFLKKSHLLTCIWSK